MVKVAYDKEKKDWIELESGAKHGLYIDGFHKQNLDIARTIIKKDWDMIFVYDGYEGTGKSVKAMQDAFYCDPTLNIDRIVFNPNDFQKAVEKATKFQSIVFDEAYGGLSSRGAMSTVNKSLTQMMTVIRAKNLFIFIVLPSFFDLDKYVALWRGRALIHVYTGENFQRGFFEFYGKERMKNMYVMGKKLYNYKCQKPNFRGSFTNTYVIDEKEYRDKKNKTSLDSGENGTTLVYRKAVQAVRREIALSLKYKDIGLTVEQQAQVMGVTRQTLSRYMREQIGDKGFKDEDLESEGEL